MTKALMLIDVQRNMLEPPTPVPSSASTREALQDLLLLARQEISIARWAALGDENGGAHVARRRRHAMALRDRSRD